MSQQSNNVDCGVYALLFAERLLSHYGEYTLSFRMDRGKKRDQMFSFLQFEPKCADELRERIRTTVEALNQKSKETVVCVEESDDSDIEVLDVNIKVKPVATRSVKRKQESESNPSLPRKAPKSQHSVPALVSPFPRFMPDYYPHYNAIYRSVYVMPQLYYRTVDPRISGGTAPTPFVPKQPSFVFGGVTSQSPGVKGSLSVS